jgi:hypothetical protein
MSEHQRQNSFTFVGGYSDSYNGFPSQDFGSFYGVEMCGSAAANSGDSSTPPALYPELQECLAPIVERPQQNQNHPDPYDMRLSETEQYGVSFSALAHFEREFECAFQDPSSQHRGAAAAAECPGTFAADHVHQTGRLNPTASSYPSGRNLSSRRGQPSRFVDMRTTVSRRDGDVGDLRSSAAFSPSGCQEEIAVFASPSSLASSDGGSLDSSLHRFPQLQEGFNSRRTGSSVTPSDVCQASGCGASLEREKIYCKRYRLCSHCIGHPILWINGTRKRLCQQCSLLHEVGEFDGEKKSCRKKLAAHALRLRNKRRQASRLGRMKSGTSKEEVGMEEEAQ